MAVRYLIRARPDTCQSGRKGLSEKGTPAPARTETGVGTAHSAMHGHLQQAKSSTPYLIAQIRGQLLSGVRSQQHNQYQRDDRGKNQLSHGDTLLCCQRRAQALAFRRVTVPVPYIQISRTPQRLFRPTRLPGTVCACGRRWAGSGVAASAVFERCIHAERAAGAYGGSYFTNLTFSSCRVVPTAEENRPVTMAVRYLIRARPDTCQSGRKGLSEKGTPAPARTGTGVGTAHSAWLHGHLTKTSFRPRIWCADTGSTAIWSLRPAAGSVSARGSRQKPAFAW